MQAWWQFEVEQVARELQTDALGGLSEAEARSRLAQYGLNQLREQKGPLPSSWISSGTSSSGS